MCPQKHLAQHYKSINLEGPSHIHKIVFSKYVLHLLSGLRGGVQMFDELINTLNANVHMYSNRSLLDSLNSDLPSKNNRQQSKE